MAIDFPSSPANNQVYVDTTSGYSFTYFTPPGVWKSTGLSVPATDRQYVFTNTITFSNVITFSANVLANTVNAASHTVGATFTANATLVNAAAINVTGQVNTATLNVGANNRINATSLLISTNSTVNAIITSTSITLANTTTTTFMANTTGLYHSNLVVANTLSLTGSIAANNLSLTGGLFPLTFSGAPNVSWVIGTLSLNNASAANTDVDITNYVTNSPFSLSSVTAYVQGQYIANTNATQVSSGVAASSQSHLSKSFKQNVWANSLPSYVLEGGTVFETYNGDVTNFPAGAINVAKVLLVANTVGVYLRLIQRTTPAAQSATYYSYRLEIQKW